MMVISLKLGDRNDGQIGAELGELCGLNGEMRISGAKRLTGDQAIDANCHTGVNSRNGGCALTESTRILGVCDKAKMTGQHRNSSGCSFCGRSRQFVFTRDDGSDADVGCSRETPIVLDGMADSEQRRLRDEFGIRAGVARIILESTQAVTGDLGWSVRVLYANQGRWRSIAAVGPA